MYYGSRRVCVLFDLAGKQCSKGFLFAHLSHAAAAAVLRAALFFFLSNEYFFKGKINPPHSPRPWNLEHFLLKMRDILLYTHLDLFKKNRKAATGLLSTLYCSDNNIYNRFSCFGYSFYM